jgi:hypothetical protein
MSRHNRCDDILRLIDEALASDVVASISGTERTSARPAARTAGRPEPRPT